MRDPVTPLLTLVAPPGMAAELAAALHREPRLHELVRVVADAPAEEAGPVLVIGLAGITGRVDWSEALPPVVLPQPLPFTKANLLALVFLHLGNWEKAYEYAAADATLRDDLDLLNRLQAGVSAEAPAAPINDVGSFRHYRRWHNRAVALHYGNLARPAQANDLHAAYQQAIAHAPAAAWQAFSAKHYATFLLDNGQLNEACRQLAAAQNLPLDATAYHELLSIETGVLLQQLTVPYDAALLSELKDKLWQTLQYHEQHDRGLNAALTLLDAAQVANFSDSFAEALGYLNRAVALLETEDAPELLANAQYRKGVLLFTWAQNGNPQFYRGAMTAYQQALKVFTRNDAYPVFAEIQHHLGIIYSEIPDEVKKKSIWAAVSVSSFNQALEYFTRETHPYEYATISNHYANALTKYPLAARTDNFAKALDYYREALAVRTARDYPYERTLTILNFLEAAWQVNLENYPEPEVLLTEMTGYAQQVSQLVDDPALREEAQRHLAQLELLQVG
ncbi:tetratricopeptide repeat protein [Hymenobacter terricola]|uniref:hypothetical protein n=1 Tax=Hymenobacter terricola TaxID=2819236 RepID=UPI001CF3F1AA|nr:hypothetical protein [Hymenobacter terricola]